MDNWAKVGQALLFCLCLLAPMQPDRAEAAHPDDDGGDCPRTGLVGELLEEDDLKIIREALQKPDLGFLSIYAAKLFYLDSDGNCLPTDDTYLVSFSERAYPQIIEKVPGQSLTAQVDSFDGDYVLSVFHQANSGQYALNMYKLVAAHQAFNGLISKPVEVEGRPFNTIISNLGSIEMQKDRIVVKNSVRSEAKKHQERLIESYRYQAGKFELEKGGSE